jgi:nucleotide-binding universal stress UspA family protein
MNTLVTATSPSPSNSPCPSPHATAIAHVLVCLDRSALSATCLPYARFMADAFGAKITLLHVMPSSPGVSEPSRVDALEWQIAKREADQYLIEAKTSLGVAPQETQTHLIQGSPAEQIVATAREVGADLTILSSQGEGGGDRPELGSITQHVLASAVGSVLLTQPGSSAHVPPRRIVVPLDGSLRSESVLPLVASLAHLHGTEVLLLHVVTEPTPTAVLSDPDDMQLALSLAARVQANAEGYLAKIRARLLPQVPEVKTFVVRRTDERQGVLDLASQQSADMVVLTAHGSTCNVERVFGSVASYVLAHARLPIFVLQEMPRNPRDSGSGQGARPSPSTRPPEVD